MNVINLQHASGKAIPGSNTGISSKQSISLASFIGFDGDGKFLIKRNNDTKQIHALSTIGLSHDDIGAEVAVAYIHDDAHTPIIIGRIYDANKSKQDLSVKMDKKRIVLHAEHDIELRCGDASIVLTRAGKVLIKGHYVLTRSSGANKIKGAYIDIN